MLNIFKVLAAAAAAAVRRARVPCLPVLPRAGSVPLRFSVWLPRHPSWPRRASSALRQLLLAAPRRRGCFRSAAQRPTLVCRSCPGLPPPAVRRRVCFRSAARRLRLLSRSYPVLLPPVRRLRPLPPVPHLPPALPRARPARPTVRCRVRDALV